MVSYNLTKFGIIKRAVFWSALLGVVVIFAITQADVIGMDRVVLAAIILLIGAIGLVIYVTKLFATKKRRGRLIHSHRALLPQYALDNHFLPRERLIDTPLIDFLPNSYYWLNPVQRRFFDGWTTANYTYTGMSYGVMPYIGLPSTDRYYYYSIVQYKLDGQLPHMFFNSQRTHSQSVDKYLDAAQLDKLEYGFERYFTIYFPEQYHIDARSVISPEVLEALLPLTDCDVEIYANTLTIYSPLREATMIPAFIEQTSALYNSMATNAQNYRDTRPTTAVAESSIVRPEGRRLKSLPLAPIATDITLALIAMAWLSFFGGLSLSYGGIGSGTTSDVIGDSGALLIGGVLLLWAIIKTIIDTIKIIIRLLHR